MNSDRLKNLKTMKIRILLFVIILNNCLVFSQELKKEYQQKISYFIDCVKNDKKSEIANMISYPFRREYPLPKINSKQEFINRYNEIFDEKLKKIIIQSNPNKDWSEVGWRGIMLYQGEIWIDTVGRIMTINYQSKSECDKLAQIINAEKKAIHPSLATFVRPICILETSKFRIRIDAIGDFKYRYSSWSINKAMSSTPDLIITNGEYVSSGTGGNHSYIFKNGNYTYECSIIVMGEQNSPPAMVTIYNGEKEILVQNAKKLQN